MTHHRSLRIPPPVSPAAALPADAVLLVGIGNLLRGDDAAGILAVRQAALHLPQAVRCTTCRRDGLDLLSLWQGTAAVLMVDAVVSGAPAGTLRLFDVHDAPLPVAPDSPNVSHGFDLAAAVELARKLDRLPRTLLLLGLEGIDFAPGASLSPAVAQALPRAAEWSCWLMGRLLCGMPPAPVHLTLPPEGMRAA